MRARHALGASADAGVQAGHPHNTDFNGATQAVPVVTPPERLQRTALNGTNQLVRSDPFARCSG